MKMLEADGGELLRQTTRGGSRMNPKGGPLAEAPIGMPPSKDGIMSPAIHLNPLRVGRGVPIEVAFVFRVNSAYGIVFRTITTGARMRTKKTKPSALLAEALEQSGVELLAVLTDVLATSTMFPRDVARATFDEENARAFVARGILKGRSLSPDPYAQATLLRIGTESLLAANEPALRVQPAMANVEEEADALLGELGELAGWGFDD
jgi:hypothetical protein